MSQPLYPHSTRRIKVPEGSIFFVPFCGQAFDSLVKNQKDLPQSFAEKGHRDREENQTLPVRRLFETQGSTFLEQRQR